MGPTPPEDRPGAGRGPAVAARPRDRSLTGSATLLASTRITPGPADRATDSAAFWFLGPEPVVAERDPVVPGRRVGSYLLVEPLGAGAQAVVWRARPVAEGGREVALKLLTPDRGREHRRVARLRREALRGARLSHPAILKTLEFGESEGVVYLAMPLVDGPSLADIIDRRRRSKGRPQAGRWRLAGTPDPQYTRAIVGGLCRIARALQVAHDGRVAHRDLKPANVLFHQGRAARSYLTDFGLARDLDVATPEQLRDWSGSPLYMAPERLLGRLADEIRSDIYSLGATLFEAVTLTRPLRAPAGVQGPILLAQLAAQRPVPPRTARPDLPAALETVLLRAMDADPERRYPSAAALADDLDAFLSDTSTRARRRRTPAPSA